MTLPGIDARLQLLHWNIHGWRDDTESNLDQVVQLIHDTRPAVVSLVEVDETWAATSSLDEVAARAGYRCVFVPSFEFGKDSADPAGGFGNALLTTLEILAVRQRQLTWPSSVYDGSEPSESRAVVLMLVESALGPVWVGSTHLPRSDTASRLQAATRLAGITRALPEPWVVCGDYNAEASTWCPDHEHLAVAPSTAIPTYPTGAPVEAIDYAVHATTLEVRAEVLSLSGSDHLPVRFTVSRRRPVELL